MKHRQELEQPCRHTYANTDISAGPSGHDTYPDRQESKSPEEQNDFGVLDFLYHQQRMYSLTWPSARCEMRTIDQRTRSIFLLKYRWIPKRQRICFAVTSTLDKGFIRGSLRFDVGAVGWFPSLRKSEHVQLKNRLYYLDDGGSIHDWRA